MRRIERLANGTHEIDLEQIAATGTGGLPWTLRRLFSDGWGRPLLIEVGVEEITLTSYGRDGVKGGAQDDADAVMSFPRRSKSGADAGRKLRTRLVPPG
jgi:Type II secretion system (T2SS), protein G